ncbi:MAG: putative terminase small subunit [Prokaryotic dsDNA virus sp.]|nr:MAG: putative terminase small subunit [Prokaryotic dsDNA virus sp.]
MAYLPKGSEPPTTGKGSKLSPKMRAFVDEYMITQNASEACVKAGYKTKNPGRMAAELMSHPLIEREIEKRLEDRTNKAELRADYLINKLVEIIDNPEERTSDTLRAIELAGKTLALWRERQEITGADGGAVELEQKKIDEDAADFTRQLSRLARRAGEGEVAQFPKPGTES